MAAEISDIRIGVHPGKTRLVLQLSRKEDFRATVLDNPYRLAVDLPLTGSQVPAPRPDGDISGLKATRLPDGLTRLEFRATGAIAVGEAFTMANPSRIVIDVAPTSAAGFKSAQGKSWGGLAPMALASAAISPPRMSPPVPAAKPKISGPKISETPQGLKIETASQKRVIALDAGHGGEDPGAIGPNGLKEKNITLTFARELKKVLESTGRYKVVLTREKDQYLKLFRRVELARAAGADLFISLHADSVGRGDTRGASVYTLSEKASDGETARLAERENRVDAISGIDLSHEEPEVASILIDLAMRDTMNESKFFANTLVKSMKGESVRFLPNPHRSAGFAVLKAADMPAVLVELGFISSPTEARQLNSTEHRALLARGIRAGIDSYFNRLEALQRS